MSEPRGPARRLIVRKSSEIEGNTGEKWADGAGRAPRRSFQVVIS